VAAGELTYAWSTSYQHQHSFSPLILSYEFMNSRESNHCKQKFLHSSF
jgi:hypothetical protein